MNEYTAWVLRYVPNLLRGEFINFGILAGRDGGDWAIEHVADLSRATCIGGEQVRPRSLLERFHHDVHFVNGEPVSPRARGLWTPGSDSLSAEAVSRVRQLSHNALQFSEPMPSLGDSAVQVAQRLYEQLVVEPVHHPRPRPRTTLRNRVRDLISQVEISRSQAVQGQELRSANATADVDFLFGPTGPVKLTHCLTFARQNASVSRNEADHWTLFVDGIRRRGATTMIGSGSAERLVQIPRDIEVSVIHDAPVNKDQTEALQAAQDGWHRFEITAVPVSAAAADVARTAELLPA